MPKQSWFSVNAFRAETDSADPADPADPNTQIEPSEVEPEITPDGAEITISGYIGEWNINDRCFIDAVEALGDVKSFRVMINSRGGDVDHALAIFNYLHSCTAEVVVQITGVAMSAASIIAMAGDRIEMPANTLMMIHNPWSCACGDDDDMANAAVQLKAWKAALIATYVARTGKTPEDVAAMMKAETYMTAQEAVDAGFADVVLPIDRAAASASASPVAMAMASALGIPPEVTVRIAAAAKASLKPQKGGGRSGPSVADASTQTPAKTFSAQLSEIAVAAGLGDYVSALLLDANITDMAQARAAISEACEIRDLCVFAKSSDQAAGFIQARKTLAEVRAALVDARAAAANNHPTNGHQPSAASKPTTTPGKQAIDDLGDVYARNRASAAEAFPRMF